MILTMNGQAVDIRLENERTLADLLSAVEKWLEADGFSVSAVAVDGRALTAANIEAAAALSLESVERLDLGVSAWTELYQEALGVAAEAVSGSLPADVWHASPAAAFLAERDPELLAQLAASLPPTGTAGPELLETLRERGRELDDPRAELARLAAGLEPMSAALEDLPLRLQTGKDLSAAQTLRDFSGLAAKMLRLVPLLKTGGSDLTDASVGGQDFRGYIEEFSTALRELVDAYASGDAILVGDLAEYELAPRLRALADTIRGFPA
jgi:hypothetical protein